MIQGVESSPFLLAGIEVLHDHSVGLNAFWLFGFKTGHEPVELLPGQLLYFQLISGPAESALDFHTFIQQHKSVRFPEQSFDSVTTFSQERYRALRLGSIWS